MKAYYIVILLFLSAASLAAPAIGLKYETSIDPRLIIPFGVTPGIPSLDQLGSCQGYDQINIPCKCPPTKEDFLNMLQKFNTRGDIFGSPFHFDTNLTDQSAETQLARINAAIVALQNLDDTTKGKGCPARAAAPNFVVAQMRLTDQIRAIVV